MRDLGKAEQLLGRFGGCCPDTLELLQLDVTDPRSLAAAAQRLQGQQLDVLGMALSDVPAVLRVAGGGLFWGHQLSPEHWEQVAHCRRCWQSWGWNGAYSVGQGFQSWGLGVPGVTGSSVLSSGTLMVQVNVGGLRCPTQCRCAQQSVMRGWD